VKSVIQFSCLTVNSLCRRNYWDHHCGFRRNRSAIDQMFRIRQILEKNWEYKGEVHQLFVYLEKAYDLVRREVLCSILTEFGIPTK
jgi:hypothetical protein